MRAPLLLASMIAAGCSVIVPGNGDLTPDLVDAGQDELDAGPDTDVDSGLIDGGADGGCATTCDGVCTNTQTDPLHCGDCATSCSAPEHGQATCEEASCGFACDPGYYAVVGTCEPRLAPRPIAPLSTSTATSRRPTFHWELAPRNDGARIEICADRACSTVLQTIDASGTSGRPSTELPPGVVFWRVYGREGSEVGVQPSVTWQLYIGVRSADDDVDTSWGTTLDVNGDGFADVIVGAPQTDNNPTSGEPANGAAYVYLGGASGIEPTPMALDNGSVGGHFGLSIASAGDVDGNGYADFLIGAPSADSYNGRAYVYLNGPGGVDPEPQELDTGEDDGEFGWSVAPAGDVDGNGYADFLVGAHGAAAGSGRAYLYLNSAGHIDATPTTLNNSGETTGFGHAVASAGDVDGDGFADFLISAVDSDSARAFLYLNSGGAVGAPMELGGGVGATPYLGSSIAGAGDVNGDGYADFLVGDIGDNSVYVFVNDGGNVDLAPDRLAEAPGSLFGYCVARAGDVDRNGYMDLVIGTFGGEGDRAYLYLNGSTGIDSTPTELNDAATGSNFGSAVTGAGDLDGNGYADVLVGAKDADSGNGRAYLYMNGLGGIDEIPAELESGTSASGSFGWSVAGTQ